MYGWIVPLSCSRVWVTTASQMAVDVCGHEVTTVQLAMTVRTSFVRLKDTGVERSATTHCTATEVTEKPLNSQSINI